MTLFITLFIHFGTSFNTSSSSIISSPGILVDKLNDTLNNVDNNSRIAHPIHFVRQEPFLLAMAPLDVAIKSKATNA